MHRHKGLIQQALIFFQQALMEHQLHTYLDPQRGQ